MPRSISISRLRGKAARTSASSWRLRGQKDCARPSLGATRVSPRAEMDNLGRLLLQRFAACHDHPALCDVDGTVAYRELSETALAVERVLRAAGLEPDEPVIVPVANEARDPAALIGTWLAGGVAVPVARQAPKAAIDATSAATGARFSLTNGPGECVSRIKSEPPSPRPLLRGAAIIDFTSGSTGRPKGVVLSHRAFAGKLEAIDGKLGFTPSTRALLVLQITFIFGQW